MDKTILIVDDFPYMTDLLQQQVECLGYSCIVANDGKRALELTFSKQPDLITLDFSLPDMDGFEFLRLIRQNPNTCNIPILAVTARNLDEIKQGCLQNGCDDYIAKPCKPKELFFAIDKLLKRNKDRCGKMGNNEKQKSQWMETL